MLTPQAIKDQEFQIKFRGYDAIEVKAYLELLADDYFELTEQNRVQAEEIERLMAELETLQSDKESLAAEVKASQESVDSIQAEIEDGYKHKDQEIEELKAQIETLQSENTELEVGNGEKLERISELEKKLTGEEGEIVEDRAELEKLRARLEVLEEQNEQLKQEGFDFKTTILAAQKFADNLKETTEIEAEKMLEEARAEVEQFRLDSEAELSRLPQEIEALSRRKQEVREELRTVLESYLNNLDAFPEKEQAGKDDDLSDLFESIDMPEIESIDSDNPEASEAL